MTVFVEILPFVPVEEEEKDDDQWAVENLEDPESGDGNKIQGRGTYDDGSSADEFGSRGHCHYN